MQLISRMILNYPSNATNLLKMWDICYRRCPKTRLGHTPIHEYELAQATRLPNQSVGRNCPTSNLIIFKRPLMEPLGFKCTQYLLVGQSFRFAQTCASCTLCESSSQKAKELLLKSSYSRLCVFSVPLWCTPWILLQSRCRFFTSAGILLVVQAKKEGFDSLTNKSLNSIIN